MKTRYKILAISASLALTMTGIAYALSIATISTTITVITPPVQVVSASFAGNPCTVSGSQISCSGSVAQGSSVLLSITVNNPASIPQSAYTISTVPSTCSGITFTDVSSTSISASSSTLLNVKVSVSATASLLTCSITTSVMS